MANPLFVLKTLEKVKETCPKFGQAYLPVLEKMTNYEEAKVKLTNSQLNSLIFKLKIRLEKH